jgi:hypothetical protein
MWYLFQEHLSYATHALKHPRTENAPFFPKKKQRVDGQRGWVTAGQQPAYTGISLLILSSYSCM